MLTTTPRRTTEPRRTMHRLHAYRLGVFFRFSQVFMLKIKILQTLPTSQVKILIFPLHRLHAHRLGAFFKFSQVFRSKI